MTLHLKVKPGSNVDQLFYDAAGLLNARIKAPARDGKANVYLVEFLAGQFGVAKSRLTIRAGLTSPHKRLEIDAEESLINARLAAI